MSSIKNLIEPMAQRGHEVGDTVIKNKSPRRTHGRAVRGQPRQCDDGRRGRAAGAEGHRLPCPGQSEFGGFKNNPAREFEQRNVNQNVRKHFRSILEDPTKAMDPKTMGYTQYRDGQGTVGDVRKAVFGGSPAQAVAKAPGALARAGSG